MLLGRFTCCLMLLIVSMGLRANELPAPQALDIIAAFASKICTDIPLQGSSSSVSGKLDAEVAGLFKKLAKAGLEVQGEARTEAFNNVLRPQLLEALKNSSDCKRQIADKLIERLLPLTSSVRNSGGGERAGIMFPRLIADIERRNFASVPDDQYFRSYLVSFYKGMYDVCEPGGNGIGLAAGRYGFPQVRVAIDNPDPYRTIGRFLQDMAAFTQSGGSLSSIQAMAADQPTFYRPGITDGMAYASELTCRSMKLIQLRNGMAQLMEARQGAPAETSDIQRWNRLMSPEFRTLMGTGAPAMQVGRDQLHKACVDQLRGLTLDRDKQQWCGCAIRLAVGGGVDLSLQNEMLEDFEWAMEAAKKKNPQFASSLGQCAV